MDISSRLKLLMSKKNVSVPKLSQDTGIPVSTIKNYLYKGQEPRSTSMSALEHYFNVTGAYLRGEVEDPHSPVWDVPIVREIADKTDGFLSQKFLPAFHRATPKAQNDICDALTQMYRILSSGDIAYQENGAALIRSFCANAENFMFNCAGTSQKGNPLFQRGIALSLISDELKTVSDYYLSDSSSNTMPQD